ncbi:MAG: Hsp20/alpha crystallin family protein [Saprospiraceae bacterium]
MTELMKKKSLFPAFFDDFFTKDFFDWNDKNFTNIGSTLPSANLMEDDKKYNIELAVPGMKKEDFKIELTNGILTVTSEKKEEKEEKDKDGKYLRREFRYSSFNRSFNLPANIKEEDVHAKYDGGILHIEIGKTEVKTESNKKWIPIK